MNIKDSGRWVSSADLKLYHDYIISLDVEDIQDSINNDKVDEKIEIITKQFNIWLTEKIKGNR